MQIRRKGHFNLNETVCQMKADGMDVQSNDYLMITELDGHRTVLFKDGRILVHGTKDITAARALYQKYFS